MNGDAKQMEEELKRQIATETFIKMQQFCRFFVGQYEDEEKTELVLTFCNNKENAETAEGNCNYNDCPLLRR